MTWLPVVVVALAAWRTFQLLALDDITKPVRDRITNKRVVEWIECPYCFGFWVALAWAGYLAVDQEWAFWTGLPFAISTIVVAISAALAD